MRFVICFSVILLVFSQVSQASTKAAAAPIAPDQSSTSSPENWSFYYPFVPEKKTYSIEVGSMWEQRNLYWLGGSLGFHVGRCVFSESQRCQQYIDFIGGAGGRDGQTNGLILLGPRWQYVHWPKPFSPSFRLVTGPMNIRDNQRQITYWAWGATAGFSTAVHPKLDIKLETRLGYADRVWGQTLISATLKIDQWVDFYADKIKRMGETISDETLELFRSDRKNIEPQ